MVFADIQERLNNVGLGEKVQLFVLPDPEAEVSLAEPLNKRFIAMDKWRMDLNKRIGYEDSAERKVPYSSERKVPYSAERKVPYSAERKVPLEASKPVILALPKELTPDESKPKKGWIRKIGKVRTRKGDEK